MANNYIIWQTAEPFPSPSTITNKLCVLCFSCYETLAVSCSSVSRTLDITEESGFGRVGAERRQLLDKIRRPPFVPDNKRPHPWSSSTAAAR